MARLLSRIAISSAKWRGVVAHLACAALTAGAFSTVSVAQPQRIARIGYLSALPSGSPASSLRLEAFRKGLREAGLIEGRSVVLELRSSEGNDQRLPELAEGLVQSKVDVVLTAGSTPATVAAKKATQTIPIVFAASADPVASGLVSSLARPGGNVTGLSLTSTELSAKRLALIRELAPRASDVVALTNPANPVTSAQVKELRAGAKVLGLRLETVGVRNEADIETAFAQLAKQRCDALLLLQEPLFLSHRGRIIERIAALGVPAITPWKEYPQSGALVAYGPDVPDLFRRAAGYVAKILNGAKPGDLPIEQPVKFELVINLKAASALGLTIPSSLRIQADQLIE